MKDHPQIFAENINVGSNFEIGSGSSIEANEVIIGNNVRIGSNVEIKCDRLEIADDSKIELQTQILCPDIKIKNGASIGRSSEINFNKFFHLDRFSIIGKHATMTGQGFSAGEFLFVGERLVVGGGGAKGPRSFLKIGKHSSIFDNCFINISEPVEIGDGSALSSDVSLLTHAAWQPAMSGYATNFAPIKIGNHAVVYLNSVVLPGVTIGDFSTIGANSLVSSNIPNNCLAAGSPAKVRKGPEGYHEQPSLESKNKLLEEILKDYLTTLPDKGVEIISDTLVKDGKVQLQFQSKTIHLAFLKDDSEKTKESKPEISIAVQKISSGAFGICHFDLENLKMTDTSVVAEDLRDFLRRRAIRIFTDLPFRSLPLLNFQRLQNTRRKT